MFGLAHLKRTKTHRNLAGFSAEIADTKVAATPTTPSSQAAKENKGSASPAQTIPSPKGSPFKVFQPVFLMPQKKAKERTTDDDCMFQFDEEISGKGFGAKR